MDCNFALARVAGAGSRHQGMRSGVETGTTREGDSGNGVRSDVPANHIDTQPTARAAAGRPDLEEEGSSTGTSRINETVAVTKRHLI